MQKLMKTNDDGIVKSYDSISGIPKRNDVMKYDDDDDDTTCL